ncbi:hypothetical protein [Ensifer sp. BR816]|uniref:hypothetical protein n=1 Tax=Rhizobium sp. (strain BR816) TaxID=1057002 RepID=UPI0003A6748D|nr:hypothetical protein [Ensifer sp. BR816]
MRNRVLKSFMVPVLAFGIICPGTPDAVHAETSATTVVQTYLANGQIGEADEQLLALTAAATGNADAQLGLGLVRAARAFEKLSQALYRVGFASKAEGYQSLFGLRAPIPLNPNPEPVTYDAFRAMLAAFIADLESADRALQAVGDRPAKLSVDLSAARFDWNGDGRLGPEDHFGMAISDIDESGHAKPFVVGFDTADAKWLRGYCNLLMAVTKAWLSHDFSESWDYSFPLLFPRAVSTMAAAEGGDVHGSTAFGLEKQQADDLADLVTLLHTIRWPVKDKVLWAEVRDHLKSVIALNRETWAFIGKETDDDHEWLPGPRQTSGALPSLNVTEERVQAWLGLLSRFEAALDGKLLIRHWRFAKGINAAKLFEEPKSFDLILWVTGPAALPYLSDGPVMDGDEWNQILAIFEGNFAAYAFYFN